MKEKSFLAGFLFLISIFVYNWALNDEFPVLKGDYLGQKPPGTTPEVFAPGIVSTSKSEFNAAFSPDGKLLFFSVNESSGRETMVYMRYESNQWTPPQSAPFVSNRNDCDPFFSQDGSRLYFISTRPKKNDERSKDWDIWYVERTDSGWSEPRNLGPPVNSNQDEYYVSLTREKTIYFASNRAGGYGSFDIYRSKFVDGHYLKPENLGASINTKYLEHDPFIAPDDHPYEKLYQRHGLLNKRTQLLVSYLPIQVGSEINEFEKAPANRLLYQLGDSDHI